jgi:hypothetical protein
MSLGDRFTIVDVTPHRPALRNNRFLVGIWGLRLGAGDLGLGRGREVLKLAVISKP